MADGKESDIEPKTRPDTGQNTGQNVASKQTWFKWFWPLLLCSALSIIWIGICIWWFIASGKTIARMPIYEAGGLLAGASLPLILVWLIALVYLRTDPLREHRTALTHGLDGLLAPLDVAQKRVNSIVAELHKEIHHVEAASDIATTRIDNLENRFQDQISNLFEVTTDAEAKAANLQTTLSTEREAFARLMVDITDHTDKLENQFRQIKFDSKSITNITRQNSEKVSNEIIFQNKTLDERSKLIEKQLEKMSVGLITMSEAISGNCETSENTLNHLSQSLIDKQALLAKGLAELSENTDDICEKMDKQSHIITELNQKTAEESEKITQTLVEQATNLTAVTADALSQTTQCGEAFQDQAAAMGQRLDEATDKSKILLDEASSSFKENAEQIVQSSQNLSDSLVGHMGRATNDLDAKSETLEHTITARLSTIEDALEKQAELIRQNLIAQTQEMQNALDQNSGKATEFITSQGSEISENMNQKFGRFMEQMEKQTDQIQLFADETTEKLEGTILSVEAQATRVDQAVKLTTGSLNKKTELMQEHYSSFGQITEEFRIQVDKSEEFFKDHHDNIVKSLSHITGQLDSAVQNLKDQSSGLGEHAQEIIGGIVDQTGHLSDHIDDIRGRTENTIRNIQDMGDTVSTYFTATDTQAAKLSENWQKTASLVENQCSDTLSRLDELAEKLIEVEKEHANAAEQAMDKSAHVSDQMHHASENIFLASASAIEAADEASAAIDQHSEKFQQLINAIQLSNKSILIDAEVIEQKNRNKNGNHFSDLASKIIEQLQSLSIDINRHFEDDISDKVWQSYIDGDKNTFIRKLKKLINKKHTDAIREKYKSDGEFRKYVLEYMQIFENLISQSMASESYSTFSVALISSETGKVYLFLAQATERLSTKKK
ncbi:hypothetical protein MNBD_ALPHA03-1909 [hydrothermal vent metagenome]|uniref:Methyl-accepting chemotaxis protein n=1 Tax=hydrothermal vent metagenome TaxID=652676 RepID=A0A3B1AGM5_9ZZZZ